MDFFSSGVLRHNDLKTFIADVLLNLLHTDAVSL